MKVESVYKSLPLIVLLSLIGARQPGTTRENELSNLKVKPKGFTIAGTCLTLDPMKDIC